MFRRRWLALAAAVVFAVAVQADVRPLSEPERAATRIVADYLARGPQAVADQLAASSPLKKLGLEEIETRLGPPADSSWELQTLVPSMANRAAAFTVEYPSGVDDTIVFEMTNDGQVNDIRVLAQKSKTQQVFPPLPKTEAAAATKPTRVLMIATLLAGLFAALLGFTGAKLRQKALILIAIVVAAGGAFLAITQDARFTLPPTTETKAATTSTHEGLELRSLLALRRAIAGGTADVDALYAHATRNGEVGRVADLWKAQWDLQQSRNDQVSHALAAFPSP